MTGRPTESDRYAAEARTQRGEGTPEDAQMFLDLLREAEEKLEDVSERALPAHW